MKIATTQDNVNTRAITKNIFVYICIKIYLTVFCLSLTNLRIKNLTT